MSANRSDQPAAIPLDVATLRPGEWLLVVQPGPLFGTWLRLQGALLTSRTGPPTSLIFEAFGAALGPSIALPPSYVRRLPARSWRTWWPRLRMRLVGSIARFVFRGLAGVQALGPGGPTRADALLAEVRRLRQENTDLAVALAKEQTSDRRRLRMRVFGGPL